MVAIFTFPAILLGFTVKGFVRIMLFSRSHFYIFHSSLDCRCDLILLARDVFLKIISKYTWLPPRMIIVFLMVLDVHTVERCATSHFLVIVDLRKISRLLTSSYKLWLALSFTSVVIIVRLIIHDLSHRLSLIESDHFSWSMTLRLALILVRIYIKVPLVLLIFIDLKNSTWFQVAIFWAQNLVFL